MTYRYLLRYNYYIKILVGNDMSHNKDQVIYVPTEAGRPIAESNRFNKLPTILSTAK